MSPSERIELANSGCDNQRSRNASTPMRSISSASSSSAARRVVAFAVVLDARRGADQHEPIDEMRRCEGEVQAQASAHRVADVRRPPALDPEHRRAGGQVGSNVAPVAVAGCVERHDLDVGTERGRESRHGRPPAPGSLREAVDEDDPISVHTRRRARAVLGSRASLFLTLVARLGGEPAEHLHEHVGILRARDRPSAIDDVRRHGRDAGVVGLLQHRRHLRGAGVTFEELHDLVAVEPDVGRAVGEHVGIADVEPVDEVGLQQPLLEGRLRDRTRRLGEPQQPVGEQRVGPQGAVHPELDAGLVRHRGDAIDDRLCLLRAAELARVGLGDRHRGTRRRPGIELERAVHHVDVELAIELGERPFEPTFADVAPRTDDVGPDLDAQRLVSAGHGDHPTPRIVGVMSVAATFCATLVDEWVRLGVRHAVVAPGSRSTPMAVALASNRDVTVHVVHDERVAAFVALGIGLGGVPAVLLCTSGTAAANFHPAVVEAGLSAVPMLVVTSDRPPELRDVGAPQTIDQTHLFGRSVALVPRSRGSRRRRRFDVAVAGVPRQQRRALRSGAPQPAVPRAAHRYSR